MRIKLENKCVSSKTGNKLSYPAEEHNEITKKTGIKNHKLKSLMLNDKKIDESLIPKYDPMDNVPKIADPVVYKTIIDLVCEGNYISTVANAAGMSPQTLYMYLERGKNGYNDLYHEFYLDFQKAYAQAEINMRKDLDEHVKNDWRVTAWKLERIYPEKYALKTVTRTEIDVRGEIEHKIKTDVAKVLLDDDSKRELARKLLEVSST